MPDARFRLLETMVTGDPGAWSLPEGGHCQRQGGSGMMGARLGQMDLFGAGGLDMPG